MRRLILVLAMVLSMFLVNCIAEESLDQFRGARAIIWDIEAAKEYDGKLCIIIAVPEIDWEKEARRFVVGGWELCFIIYDKIDDKVYLILTQ